MTEALQIGDRAVVAPSGQSDAPMNSQDRGHHVMACGNPSCPLHGSLCAYHGNENGRCPWCHASWRAITSPGWKHGCESTKTWTPAERGWRVAKAKAMRHRAETTPQIGDTGTFCAHLGTDSTGVGKHVSHSFEGTAELVEVACTGCHHKFGAMVETVAFVKCPACSCRAINIGPGRPGWN